MRISVWSPDVCSPDLGGRAMAGSVAFVATRKIDEPSAFHAIDARLAAPETVDDSASVVERLVDQKLTDGWPVVPPDAEGVGSFVAAAGSAGDSVMGPATWRAGPLTVQDQTGRASGWGRGCREE